MKKLVIIGASGHGKVVADIAIKTGYEEIVFLDDNTQLTDCAGFPVVGTSTDVFNYSEYDVFIAIGSPNIRKKLYGQLDDMKMATLIHPDAVISRRVSIGRGTVVMAGAVINSDTVVGCGCIVNTCSSIDHDCYIGDFAHISVGAHVAGTVTIRNCTWVGAGATINNNITIDENVMIGAGAVVVKNIEEGGTYVGSPARKIK